MALHRYTWRTFARELAMIIGVAVFCIPLYLVVVISLKTTPESYASPLSFPRDLQFTNYSTAWTTAGSVGMGRGLRNSLIITVGSVASLIAIGSLTAYCLARRISKLTNGLYVFFVLGIITPVQLGLVPLFVVLRHFHLVGTYFGMIALYTGLLMPVTVFLYTGFVRALPSEYEEAARVDGAKLFRIFMRIVFPLLRPITGTVAILTGLVIWNDFFVPLIFLGGSPNATLPVAVYSFVGEYVTFWNLIFAAIVISVTPMLFFYFVAQRQLVRGFASGIRG